jgi:hypothetical protein
MHTLKTTAENSLLRKLILAIPQAMVHNRAFGAFTDSLRDGHEHELREWEKIVWAWEDENEKPNNEKENPYEYTEVEGACIAGNHEYITNRYIAETMADVMLCIAEDEHKRVEENGAAALLVKPSAFLMAGIEIEESQCVSLLYWLECTKSESRETVALEAKRRTRTTIQATSLQQQRTILLGKVSALRDVQETYMPGLRRWAGQQQPPLPPADYSKPEGINIYLPSALPADVRESVCVPGLVKHEDDLRAAQAVEALRNL